MGPLSGTRIMMETCINRAVVTERIGRLSAAMEIVTLHLLLEFFLNISLVSMNSVTKVFVITLKWARTCHLLPKRPGYHHSTNKTRVRDRTFKFSPIHASVMYQIC